MLEFIKSDEVITEQGTEIVCKALNVVSIFEKTKTELIEITEYFIKNFCHNKNNERPFFLEKPENKFIINDLYKNPECKKIIDEIENKY